jgi:hypothetical protein
VEGGGGRDVPSLLRKTMSQKRSVGRLPYIDFLARSPNPAFFRRSRIFSLVDARGVKNLPVLVLSRIEVTDLSLTVLSPLPSSTSQQATMTIAATDLEPTANDIQESKACTDIKHALPNSTPEERQRFVSSALGNTTNAIKKLKYYLDWRNKYCKEESTDTDMMWVWSCQRAIQLSNDETASIDTKLPCVLFIHDYIDANSTTKRCAQVLPARVDTNLANATTYALALAIYLDQTLNRNSFEKLTLAVDVRAGKGWANISAFKLLPFIQGVTKLLIDLHPERLERCIIFPVPGIAVGIWRAVKPFLDKETSGRVFIVAGPAGLEDELPKKVPDVLGSELVEKSEKTRIDCQST